MRTVRDRRTLTFRGTMSQIGAYACYDDEDNLVGYSDVVGRIMYDKDGHWLEEQIKCSVKKVEELE